MYRSKTIYEKKFPKEEISLSDKLDKSIPANTETERLSFDEIIQCIYKDTVYVLIPGREEKARDFIRKAVEVSELYEIDIKIEEYTSHVCVTYYFNCGGGMKHLTDIIGEADDIAFFTHIKGYDIVMSLDFYTHAEYRRGRLVNP